ncbi:PorT family protein [Myroides guanonis]|uniref:Outer membrane protein beta-barrel domain-containing protein n=1 Tax=Myroides guanonis TaxID=1150112 RepID=A0A1I3QNB5_9FLAO|nr:PorT family protein [Myroides guanonis]SFJ34726.1 Outer membrane protein beta-barrel domain-containing protein [Myroides guanonis]
MRKQIKLSVVALAAFFMVSVSANAQEKVSIGLKTQVNSTFYKYDSESIYSNSSQEIGGSAGAFLKYDFNSWFALQTDLILHYRNSEMENKLTKKKSTLESYDLELPVYAVFQTKLGTGKIFVGLGPYIGYGIQAKTGDVDMYDKDVTGKKPMKQLHYGASAILGYDFGHFQINASYISQNGIGSMKETSPLRRESLGLGIGFSF